jgi:hypothetical protein
MSDRPRELQRCLGAEEQRFGNSPTLPPPAADETAADGRIATPAVRDSHEKGWDGCLDGLAGYFAA